MRGPRPHRRRILAALAALAVLAYALWPARKTHAEPPAPRWKPGLCFTLRVSGPATVDHGRVDAEAEVRRALTAWLLFGGYGGRTRRGLGAVAIDDPELRRSWLPAKATVEALRDIFPGFGRPTEEQRRSLPRLTGAALALGRLGRDGDQAAAQALDWLRQFRQGYAQGGAFGEHDPSFARVAGERNRPSVSNWPEPDKLRRLMQGRWSHTPRHLDDPAWPRAGFGLPIQIRWQRRARDGGRHYEPDDVRLEWREPGGASHDRLGSPLFVGPLQTQDGRFSPFALWLHRAYPTGGQVVAVRQGQSSSGSELPGSAAPFDKLLGAGDQALFDPLESARRDPQGLRLRHAFFDWLRTGPPRVREVTR